MGFGFDLFVGFVEVVLVFGEICQGSLYCCVFEVGLEQVGEIQFGVGQLLEKEIVDVMFVVGVDVQVGQWLVVGYQVVLEQFGGDIVCCQVFVLDFVCQVLCGLDDVLLVVVVGGDLEEEMGIVGSGGFCFVYGCL